MQTGSAPRPCRFFCEVFAVRSSGKEEDGARNDALVLYAINKRADPLGLAVHLPQLLRRR